MKALFLCSLLLQSLAIAVDEFYFHWKRNLPQWERWGHPVDTFFFLIPLGLIGWLQPSQFNQTLYVIFSVVSCLCITKDEWVHRTLAPASENWLHAVLFILHPVVLLSGFFVWAEVQGLAQVLFGLISGFMFYQLIFWNLYADRFFKSR